MNCLVEVGRTLGIGRGVCRVEADQDRPGLAGFAETRGFHTGVLVDFAVAFECFTVAFVATMSQTIYCAAVYRIVSAFAVKCGNTPNENIMAV
jgi:hypothetical protein